MVCAKYQEICDKTMSANIIVWTPDLTKYSKTKCSTVKDLSVAVGCEDSQAGFESKLGQSAQLYLEQSWLSMNGMQMDCIFLYYTHTYIHTVLSIHTARIVTIRQLSIFPKDTLTCRSEELGIKLPTFRMVHSCPHDKLIIKLPLVVLFAFQ